jgi:fumarate hydratase class II
MADSSKSFANYCIRGLKADKKKIKELLNNSLMLVTALAPHIGYDNAAKIAKNALKNETTLKKEAVSSGLVTEKEFNKIVNPAKMVKPGK